MQSSFYRRLAKIPLVERLSKRIALECDDLRVVGLDHPIRTEPRYGYGCLVHPELNQMLVAQRAGMLERLDRLPSLLPYFQAIAEELPPGNPEPNWKGTLFPRLDGLLLYQMLVERRPPQIVEIGSGYSTKIARRAIRDHGLDTKIISIDPAPRDEIDSLCDEVVRMELQDVPSDFFKRLGPGDLLFIDNSHTAAMNSDVVVCLLELIPRMPPGVLIHLHDIFFPCDYPPPWHRRLYTEQYLLAAYLLGREVPPNILVAAFYLNIDPVTQQALRKLAVQLNVGYEELIGGSFWFIK